MEISAHSRLYIISIFLVLISGKIKNSECKWCHFVLLGLAGLFLLIGIFFFLKHKNKQKRMQNYE